MQVITGTVVDGKVVVKEAELTEGATVTVIAQEADETFELNPEQERELLLSIAQADRGEFVDGHELLQRLRDRG